MAYFILNKNYFNEYYDKKNKIFRKFNAFYNYQNLLSAIETIIKYNLSIHIIVYFNDERFLTQEYINMSSVPLEKIYFHIDKIYDYSMEDFKKLLLIC